MNDGIQNKTQPERSRGPFPWQRGWAVVKATWPQLIYISMTAIAIPQYSLYLLSAHRAAGLVNELKANPVHGFLPLLEIVEKFSFSSILQIIGGALFAIWGYLAWVTSAWYCIDGQKVKTPVILARTVRTLLPSGLLTLFLFGLSLICLLTLTAALPALAFITQLLLISLCVLITAAPVLLVIDRPSARRVLGASLRLDYTHGTGVTRWSAYFILLSYEMLLMGSLSLIQAGLDALNHLDLKLGIARSTWFHISPDFPFGVLPMVMEGLAICLSAFVFAIFAVMSTCYIADLKRIGRIRSTIDIRV
ncbi:MAG: hypothetical protein NTX25_13030 [Proteobacteria bacterium]|nr:hypothetical protein [Pseudomonadota bacterium]